jgi:hypothetical protein
MKHHDVIVIAGAPELVGVRLEAGGASEPAPRHVGDGSQAPSA